MLSPEEKAKIYTTLLGATKLMDQRRELSLNQLPDQWEALLQKLQPLRPPTLVPSHPWEEEPEMLRCRLNSMR